MKFSEKVCLKVILKITKNQGFTLSLEDTLFEKPQGGQMVNRVNILSLRIINFESTI